MGAVAGGNDTGEIPAYEGAKGLTCPADYKPGQFLPNPYKGENPLFRIDHTNVGQYKERLSPGQIARLKKNKNYYMNVYPTHRKTEFCKEFYQTTEKSRESSRLDEHNVLQDFQGGVPQSRIRPVRGFRWMPRRGNHPLYIRHQLEGIQVHGSGFAKAGTINSGPT